MDGLHNFRLCFSVPFGLLVIAECRDVPVLMDGIEADIRHAEFFALIDVRRSGEGEIEHT